MRKKLTNEEILKRGGIGALKITIKEELKKIMKIRRIKNPLVEMKRGIAKRLKNK